MYYGTSHLLARRAAEHKARMAPKLKTKGYFKNDGGNVGLLKIQKPVCIPAYKVIMKLGARRAPCTHSGL